MRPAECSFSLLKYHKIGKQGRCFGTRKTVFKINPMTKNKNHLKDGVTRIPLLK